MKNTASQSYLFSAIRIILICLLVVSSLAQGSLSLNPGQVPGFAGDFHLAPRSDSARSGSEFADLIWSLPLEEREALIYAEILDGNIPEFLRPSIPVTFSESLGESSFQLVLYVMPDYLTIGSNEDHILMPMTPMLAQKLMDALGATLPTRKMVNLIWNSASFRLDPMPIPPSSAMVSVAVFARHNQMVQGGRAVLLDDPPLGALIAGHKKDVILSNRIAEQADKVVIYGWHYSQGTPIQPLYSGHVNWYADYSHGIRAVLKKCLVNNRVTSIDAILTDPVLYSLLSDESGPMTVTRYDTSTTNYPAQ